MNKVNAGPPKPINHNYAAAAPPRRPDPVEQHRAAKTNKPKLRRARFFGTHPPRDQANQFRKMPERKHAGAPSAVLARPLSLASYPVADHGLAISAPARVRGISEVNAGRRNQ